MHADVVSGPSFIIVARVSPWIAERWLYYPTPPSVAASPRHCPRTPTIRAKSRGDLISRITTLVFSELDGSALLLMLVGRIHRTPLIQYIYLQLFRHLKTT